MNTTHKQLLALALTAIMVCSTGCFGWWGFDDPTSEQDESDEPDSPDPDEADSDAPDSEVDAQNGDNDAHADEGGDDPPPSSSADGDSSGAIESSNGPSGERDANDGTGERTGSGSGDAPSTGGNGDASPSNGNGDGPPSIWNGGDPPANGDGELSVVDWQIDQPDRDTQQEWILFENTGDGTLDLSGWTVEDEFRVPSGNLNTFPFPNMTFEPGDQVRLITGHGDNTSDTVYWGIGNPVWNQEGDTVTVRNAAGEVVLSQYIEAPRNGDDPPADDPPADDPPVDDPPSDDPPADDPPSDDPPGDDPPENGGVENGDENDEDDEQVVSDAYPGDGWLHR